MPADNKFGDDGAASLAPSLGRMAQLTTLNLGGTLRDIGGSWGCFAGACERRLCMDGVCCGLGRLGARLLQVVGAARGEPRGAGGVQTIGSKQLGQRRWDRVSEG